jgi:hypothetical protein
MKNKLVPLDGSCFNEILEEKPDQRDFMKDLR